MNSNSYLGLSTHPAVISAEAQAAERYGAGPGVVRFISGTYQPHKDLEQKTRRFSWQRVGHVILKQDSFDYLSEFIGGTNSGH